MNKYLQTKVHQLVDDLKTFDKSLWKEIVYTYLAQVYAAGDAHKWHEDQEAANKENNE